MMEIAQAHFTFPPIYGLNLIKQPKAAFTVTHQLLYKAPSLLQYGSDLDYLM